MTAELREAGDQRAAFHCQVLSREAEVLSGFRALAAEVKKTGDQTAINDLNAQFGQYYSQGEAFAGRADLLARAAGAKARAEANCG